MCSRAMASADFVYAFETLNPVIGSDAITLAFFLSEDTLGDATAAATAAANSAAAALTCKNAAATSATNAGTSATAASGSATAASGSASTAANSATSAGNSARAASGSASGAATSATNAGNSATAAAGSASAASGSATAAATSATNAATSATDAATSATAASELGGGARLYLFDDHRRCRPRQRHLAAEQRHRRLGDRGLYRQSRRRRCHGGRHVLDTFDDSTNTIKGQLTLRSKASAAISYVYNVTGAVVDGGGYRKLALAYVSGAGALPTTANGIWLMFDRAGGKGGGAGLGDFTGPALPVADNIVTFTGTTGKVGKDSGIKARDLIVGPASAVADNIATFNGTSGKLAKDSGVAVSSLAPKASPTFTGTPAAPTAAPGTNTTQLATTGFVKAAIDVVLGGVSAAFDTLAEIAAAMLQKAADNTGITAGFTATAVNDGTKSSGTYTPSPLGGNLRYVSNKGARSLRRPPARAATTRWLCRSSTAPQLERSPSRALP